MVEHAGPGEKQQVLQNELMRVGLPAPLGREPEAVSNKVGCLAGSPGKAVGV